jgi:predicted  nucleic acid-binding Zn-ribbon protein
MPLNPYQIDRLDQNDLISIELEQNPTPELVRALVSAIKEHRRDIETIEMEFESLKMTVDFDAHEAVVAAEALE